MLAQQQSSSTSAQAHELNYKLDDSNTKPNSSSIADNAMSNLKRFVNWKGASSTDLPVSYRDPNHTKTQPSKTNQSSIFSTWNEWTASPPWYEHLGLTRMQRYIAFGISLITVALLFMLSLFWAPFIIVRPGKFVTPFSLASLILFMSFGFLHGFYSYARHLISKERWPFTAIYLVCTIATLWATLSIKKYLLTVPLAIIQVIAMVIYAISYIPGGASGVSLLGSMVGQNLRSKFGL